MGLDTVLNQIVAAGFEEEGRIIDQATRERDLILADAKARAEELRAKAARQAEARIESLRREVVSAAEFEARRRLLVARRQLDEDFLRRVRETLAALPPSRNQALLARLLEKAQRELPKGVVHARGNDLSIVGKGGYKPGREIACVGGFQVESADGSIVLDYRYETLLENAWKQVLSESQALFA